jgi:precorrin-6B methylase 1
MTSQAASTSGALLVVGTGIKSAGHLTADAIHWIRTADKVLYVVADAVTERVIVDLNPRAESLSSLYRDERRRLATYEAMADRIVGELRTGATVCAVFYGHPGVFVWPSHEAVRLARAEGHFAQMLPGISAEDCLFADLGVDPARMGWQSFEATDFLVRRRAFDATAGMALWQVGAIGNLGLQRAGFARQGLKMLRDVLIATYGSTHEVVVYEAAVLPTCSASMHRVALSHLLDAPVTSLSTLYVPPSGKPSLDLERIELLGLRPSDFGG